MELLQFLILINPATLPWEQQNRYNDLMDSVIHLY